MDYASDIRKYTKKVDDAAVAAIVKFCGIALQSRDASLVATSDPAEVDRVRKGFATKVLGLSDAEFDSAFNATAEKMKEDKTKHRVTFYYLLAEATGKLKSLA